MVIHVHLYANLNKTYTSTCIKVQGKGTSRMVGVRTYVTI